MPSELHKSVALLARLAHRPAPQTGRKPRVSSSARLALPGQPFDAFLLEKSPLFRRSRNLFRARGGKFEAALLSSPRTLGSVSLLDSLIEYSPVEKELLWAATDPIERRNPGRLREVRVWCTSLFHEQNHRLLWELLPPPPCDRRGVSRYLHLAESLVIAADMALGDQLGERLSRALYLCGVTYDPGTPVGKLPLSRREYRNYLQAAAYASYLNLELYDPERIPALIEALFPALGELAGRAARRACNIDRQFVERTSPVWQRRHWKEVAERLGARPGAPLELAAKPHENHVHYLWGERFFEWLGL